MVLGLKSWSSMNCPEYTGTKSSYGLNCEESNCHTGSIQNRKYFHYIMSPTEFVMIGCREDDGDNQWVLKRNSHKLAQYHPKSSGIIFCADGHVTVSNRLSLSNPANSPSLRSQ